MVTSRFWVIGHADFYPNGGEKQSGCDRDVGTHLFNLITGKIESKFLINFKDIY